MSKIVLLGKCGSGKDSIAKLLTEDFRYERAISCTTRPMREGEQNGREYYFITDKLFDELEQTDSFAETAEFRGWKYGTTYGEISKSDNIVIVTNPCGFKQLLDSMDDDFITFYIDTDDVTRILRCVNRGDNEEEIRRRYYTDEKDFDGLKDIVDFVVDNSTDNIYECLDEVLFDIMWFKKPVTLEKFLEDLSSHYLSDEEQEEIIEGILED